MREFNNAATWRGRDIEDHPDWLHTLGPDDIEEIADALAQVEARDLPLESIEASDFPLPNLAARLRTLQDQLENGVGSALVRGWPAEDYSVEQNRSVCWGLSRHLGTPISQSAKGERIFHVEDAGFGDRHAKARGPNTRKALNFHCDRCDVIGFLCLRQAKTGGDSYLVSSVTIHNELLKRRPDLLETLYSPYYYKTHNVDTSNPDPWCHQPIYAEVEADGVEAGGVEAGGVDGKLVGYVLRVLIDRAYALPELPDMTALQREALDTLGALCADPALHHRFCQQPGDFFLVNNFTNFHSRSAFEDHEDPAKRRLLLRIWLSMPNSRALPPSFAGSFGATEAGALRGGIHPPPEASDKS